MNPIGLVAGSAAFLGIWVGHLAVRKAEAISPVIWVPAAIFGCGGLLLEWVALSFNNLMWSTGLGILGITLLWDSIEIFRQERRVRNGHAPANPSNPRHRSMLSAGGTRATTLDLVRGMRL